MNTYVLLLTLLVVLNVVAVVWVFQDRGRSRAASAVPAPIVASGAEPDGIHALLEEVERSVADERVKSNGEIGLERAMRRLREAGKNSPLTAAACRLGKTA